MAEPIPAPAVDAFLTAFTQDPGAWSRLGSGERLDVFTSVVSRVHTAEVRVAELEALLVQARDVARSLLMLVTPAE